MLLFQQLDIAEEVALYPQFKLVECFRLEAILLLYHFCEVVQAEVLGEQRPNYFGAEHVRPVASKGVKFTEVHVLVSL